MYSISDLLKIDRFVWWNWGSAYEILFTAFLFFGNQLVNRMTRVSQGLLRGSQRYLRCGELGVKCSTKLAIRSHKKRKDFANIFRLF